jgi:hypothetical protein
MVLGCVAKAQTMGRTAVQETVYLGNELSVAGTLDESGQKVTMANIQAITADAETMSIKPDGFELVNLAANQAATTTGPHYTAAYPMSDGNVTCNLSETALNMIVGVEPENEDIGATRTTGALPSIGAQAAIPGLPGDGKRTPGIQIAGTIVAGATVTAPNINGTINAALMCNTPGTLDQSCITNAASGSSLHIKVPAGTYTLSGVGPSITISRRNVWIDCDSRAIFVDATTGTNGFAIQFSGVTQKVTGCTFQGNPSTTNAGFIETSHSVGMTFKDNMGTLSQSYSSAFFSQYDTDLHIDNFNCPTCQFTMWGGASTGLSIQHSKMAGFFIQPIDPHNPGPVTFDISHNTFQPVNIAGQACGGGGDWSGQQETATSVSAASGVLTITVGATIHQWMVGQQLTVALNTATWANGLQTITALGINTVSFTAAHADYAATADSGVVYNSPDPLINWTIDDNVCTLTGSTSASRFFGAWSIVSPNSHGTFTNNKTYAVGQYIQLALLEFGQSNSTIAGNQFYAPDSFLQGYVGAEIYAGGNNVYGNTFDGWSAGQAAINIYPETLYSPYANNNTISGNALTNPGVTSVGIGVSCNTIGSTAMNTVILNNLIVLGANASSKGIAVQDFHASTNGCPVQATLAGNSISGPTMMGVYLNGGTASSAVIGTNYGATMLVSHSEMGVKALNTVVNSAK